jgi:uncharacterized membrane protein HdeD (DUF308 family)
MTLLTDAPGARTLAGDTAATARKYWWLPLITGSAWMIVATLVFRFDYTTVAAVSVLFGCVALGAGINEFVLAGLRTRGWQITHALLGVLFTVISVIAFVQPWTTFVGLAAAVSIFLIVRGTVDLVTAVTVGGAMPQSWILGLVALAELGLGLWAAGSWRLSVVVLVAWVGATALMRGITEITAAFGLREVGHSTR